MIDIIFTVNNRKVKMLDNRKVDINYPYILVDLERNEVITTTCQQVWCKGSNFLWTEDRIERIEIDGKKKNIIDMAKYLYTPNNNKENKYEK